MIYNRPSKVRIQRSYSQLASLLLADSDRSFVRGVKTLLDFYKTKNGEKLKIIDEVDREHQVLDVVKQQRPDLVLLDLELKQGYIAGLELIAQLKQMPDPSKVLVLSACKEDEIVFKAMQAGAWGYVCKDNVVEQLLTAITTVLNDCIYLAPTEATSFFRTFKISNERSPSKLQKIELTERELEVLRLLVEGASNRKISEQLYITVATVKAHLTSIFEKFDVSSRTQAIVKAFKLGLV